MSDARLYITCTKCDESLKIASRGRDWSFTEDKKFSSFMFLHCSCNSFEFTLQCEDDYHPDRIVFKEQL